MKRAASEEVVVVGPFVRSSGKRQPEWKLKHRNGHIALGGVDQDQWHFAALLQSIGSFHQRFRSFKQHDPAAWAEGFVAAGSSHPGPIVLADDDRLPTETATWLGTDGDASVPLVCGALVDGAVCTDVATRLGHTG